LGKIIVTIDGIAVTGVDSNGNPGNEKWRIFTASGVLVVDWTFLSTGQNTINYSGLPAGDYIFQLGDEFRSGQLGSDGLPLYRHVLPFTILPIENPLQIASVLVEDELCFGEGGIITVEGAGGDGPATYVFSITNTSTSVSYTPTSGSGATAVFNDVPQGNYTINLSSGTRCQVSDSRAVSGPSAPLSISLIDSDGTSCSVTTSAFATWEVMGGTPAYTFVRLTREGTPLPAPSLIQTAGVFAFTNLTTGTYILTVKDSNGCEISSPPIQLNDIPAPDFQVSDAVACEGDTVILQPTIVDLSNSIPVFTWKTPQGNVITNNTTIAGITYTLSDQDSNPSTPDQLSISGLSAGVFAYTLSISGDNTCNFPDLVATVTVSEYPPVADVVPTNLDCFEDNSGELAVLMDAGVDPTAFFYEIVGVRPVQDSPIFTALPAGIYQIRVTNKVTSCETIIDNVEITQPELLEILDLDFTNPSCSFPNGTISFTLTGGTPDYLVQVNGKPLTDYTNTVNGNAYFIEDLVPDTYTISVEDKMLCQAISPPVTLVNDDLDPLSTVDIAEEICFGKEVTFTPQIATPGAFTITWFKDAAAAIPVTTTATPDADGLTFQINSTDFSLTISGLQEGDFSYFYRVEGPQLCPDYIFEAKVSVFPELKVNLLPTNEICFGASDGSITVEATGANGNFEYSLNGAPFVTSTVFGSLSPGNYTVETRSSNGCSIVETTIIEGPATPISVNTPDILRANCGLPNGIIQNLTISGGWGSYQVEWRQGSVTGTIVPGNETGAVDLFPADYFLIVTDLNGCIEIFQFEVEESSDPVYAIVPPIESCATAPITIRPIHIAPNPSLPPAAATEVRWYTGPGQTGLIQNGADPGNPAIQYSIDDTDWLNPELIIQGLPAGVYDFYFYVVCTGQEIKIDITAYDTPQVTLETNAIVCFGDANGKVKVLSGGIPSYTYSVNGGAPMNQAAFESMSLTAGTYSLAVATPAGCSQNLNFTIAGPTAPLASSPLTKIDPGCGAPNGKLNLTITGGWLPYTLDVLKDGVSLGLQSINQNIISLDGYRPGVYQIRITDKEGCSVITNTVTMVDGPTQILADSDEICVGSLASLVPTLDPVATGSTFQWFLDAAKTQPIVSSPTPAGDGRIYQINATTGELTIGNLPASITEFNYYVTASGSGVCPGFTGNGKVRVYSNPTATATVLNEVCFDDGGTITINASGGSGTYTYSLNGGGFGTSNVFKVARGTYEVEIQTPQGCGFTLSNIEVTGPIAALEGSNIQLDSPSCALENGEIRFNVAGGYPPYTISYSKNSVNAGTLNLASPGIATIANLGEGSYLFQVVDAEGCVISLPSALTLVEIPTVITAPDQVICDGGTANLTPSLPQNILNPSYVWSFDGAGNNLITSGTANGVTFTVNPNGQMSVSGLAASASPYTYYIMATGPGICGLSPTPVRVTVNPIPALRVSNPSVVCDPQGTVDLTDFIEGFNPNVYDYTVLSPSGSAMRLDEIDDVAVSGDYRVSSSFKGTGCFNQAQRIRVLISETELIANFQYKADLGGGVLIPNAEIQIQENVNFQDLSQGNVLIWDWDFGDGNSSSTQNPVHQYQNKGTYTVKLTTIDSIGCISIYEIVVQVLDDYIVMIPNAFTPTGAKNLTFKPYYRGIASMEFYIFNTWGELIYKATSMEDAGWDGTLNGKQTPNGNYVYKGQFTSRSGEVINKSGVFILIR
jgi:gliding motility-associated-like protein